MKYLCAMSALQQALSKKTDAQLKYYIDHTDKHTHDAVLAALAELKARKVELPEDVDEQIAQKLKSTDSLGNRRHWDHFDKDVEVLQFYSRGMIYVYSFLFSALYSSFLLASNFSKLGKPGYKPVVFAAVFTIGIVLFIRMLPNYHIIRLAAGMFANMIGGLVMYELFPSTPEKNVVVREGDVAKAILVGFVFSFALGFLMGLFGFLDP